MLQSAQKDASPGVEPPRTGSRFRWVTSAGFAETVRAVLVRDQMPLTYITTKHEWCCMTGGESGSGDPMEHQPMGEDQVRMVARQVSEPRTANWIASEADWLHEPTKRVLDRLVDNGILYRDDTGVHTTYFPRLSSSSHYGGHTSSGQRPHRRRSHPTAHRDKRSDPGIEGRVRCRVTELTSRDDR